MRDKAVTYKIMSAVKSKNTKPELILGSAMHKLGLRYRKHYKIEGKPDFVFVSAKIVVFCDGDFWHGNNWKIRGLSSLSAELKKYNKFWRSKIIRNINRDKFVTKSLRKKGWYVLRFWESKIILQPEKIATKIKRKYNERIIGQKH